MLQSTFSVEACSRDNKYPTQQANKIWRTTFTIQISVQTAFKLAQTFCQPQSQ